MATGTRTPSEPSEIRVSFTGEPGCDSHQIYSNNGVRISKGETLTLRARDLPEDFPFTLGQFADELESVPGMEVTK